MSRIERFGAYAEAFEKAFENDDWSVVEPYFTEDAVYETLADPPLANRSEGRKAVLAAFKQSLDAFDRRFDTRRLEMLEGPLEREGKVWLRFRASYQVAGAPELAIEGEETAEFQGDRIRRLEDRFVAETGTRVTRWMIEHGAKLGQPV